MLIRSALIAFYLTWNVGAIWAQADVSNKPKEEPQMDTKQSTGRTMTPEEKGQKQPQGKTGPLTTGSGGSPAESPQGQSPPDMQAAPEGSSKTVVEPK